MEINVLIIDDSLNDLNTIKETLAKLATNEFPINIKMSLNYDPSFLKDSYNITIIDIDMPDKNGFEIAKIIQTVNPKQVFMFCTNHDELIFDSYRLNTFFFIRKNNLEKDLSDALKKYMYTYSETKIYTYHTHNYSHSLNYSDIIYFESVRNDLFIKMNNGKEYKEIRSLNAFINDIPEKSFFQISRNYIINMAYIQQIKGNQIILKDNIKIHVSRARLAKFKQAYMDYLIL